MGLLRLPALDRLASGALGSRAREITASTTVSRTRSPRAGMPSTSALADIAWCVTDLSNLGDAPDRLRWSELAVDGEAFLVVASELVSLLLPADLLRHVAGDLRIWRRTDDVVTWRHGGAARR